MSDIEKIVRNKLNSAVYFWEPKEGNLNLGKPHLGFEKLVNETTQSIKKLIDEARLDEATKILRKASKTSYKDMGLFEAWLMTRIEQLKTKPQKGGNDE